MIASPETEENNSPDKQVTLTSMSKFFVPKPLIVPKPVFVPKPIVEPKPVLNAYDMIFDNLF